MNIDLEYRKCTASDLDVLVSLSKNTFINAFEKDNNPEDFKKYIETAFSENTILSQLENPNSLFYFAYYKGQLIGYFKINVDDAQNEIFTESSIELERIYIVKEHQNKGLGKFIINYIITLAKSQTIQFLWLGVWEKNKAAIRFYQRFGFIKFNTHPYYIGTDKQTDWLMKLDFV